MTPGLLMIGAGAVLCAAALILIIGVAATAKSAKKKIMDEMGRKY